MSYFKNASKSEDMSKGNYINPGIYELGLKKLAVREGHKGVNLIGEFEVLSATKTETNEANAVGTTVAAVISLEKKDMGGLVKNLINACSPEPLPTDLEKWEAYAQKMTSETQPMRGVRVKCEASTLKREGKADITAKSFKSIVGQTSEAIKALRAKFDGV